MPYPEVPMDVVYFMFGVIVGMFLTGALFVALHYIADRERRKGLNSIGVFKREEVSKEFLKTIEGIDEKLKRKQ